MRTIEFNKANDNELYNKSSLTKQLNVSMPTVEKYVLDDDFENKVKYVGKRKVYLGSDVNDKIEKLSNQYGFIIFDR